MMHPRNRHQESYNFQALIAVNPDLRSLVIKNKFGGETIDFSNPLSVRALNKALLFSWYGLTYWDIPENFLCPPIPGRADYIHYVSDLFHEKKNLRVLDIGTGANLIYPLIGHFEYGWTFIGSDIHPLALNNAEKIILENCLKNKIETRLQKNKTSFFEGIISEKEFFNLSICNPPFHSSPAEAAAGTERKWKNLGKGVKGDLNFSGSKDELWCEGGEREFILKMIKESERFKNNVQYFSSIVSKEKNLPPLEKTLEKLKAKFQIMSYGHGNKQTRILIWTYKLS